MRSMNGIAAWLAVLAVSCSFAAAGSDSGEVLYKARCAKCHGKNGEGKAGIKAPSLVSPTVKVMSDDALKEVIQQRTNGEMERKSAHAAMKKRLTAEQTADLVIHIRKMQSR